MRVQCSTCLELLVPGDDLTCTPCGHVFHHACVLQWFETKKNCPQCRHPSRENTLRKIFLAETDGDDSILEDSGSLRNQLDGVQLQLRIKETEKSKLSVRNKELEQQSVLQREEIKVLEKGKEKLKQQYDGMKNQARLLQGEKVRADEATKEAQEVRSKMENFKSVEVALRGQQGALNDFLHERGAFDGRTKDLATLVIMLKTKLGEVKRERSKAEVQLKEAEMVKNQDRMKLKQIELKAQDLQATIRSSEADLKAAKAETIKLQERLKQADQKNITSETSQNSPCSSWVESQEELEMMEDIEEFGEDETSGHKLPSFTLAGLGGSSKSGPTDLDTPPLAAFNILPRKPLGQVQHNKGSGSLSQQYDGLGGRARDLFPHTSRVSSMQVKSSSQGVVKKRKLAPFAKAPVSKQMKTINKYFGDFDTP